MSITDERLDELASTFERTSGELEESGMDHTWDADTAAALRELQLRRMSMIMDPEQVVSLVSYLRQNFCMSCGRNDPSCPCENDE